MKLVDPARPTARFSGDAIRSPIVGEGCPLKIRDKQGTDNLRQLGDAQFLLAALKAGHLGPEGSGQEFPKWGNMLEFAS